MKERLHQSSFWNIAPRNRTQTFYTRFLKGPGAELKSQLTESRESFNGLRENALKTRYSELLEG